MSSNDQEGRRPRKHKDAGPQGTQVFSRDEVDRLLDQAGDQSSSSHRAEIRGVSASVSGRTFALQSASMVVGRSADCSIQLDESSVSSEHARLVRDEDGWRAINLLSTNGTFINDQKISNAPLTDGDHVRFGRVEFVFHDPDSGKQTSAGLSGWQRWVPWAVAIAAVLVVIAVLVLS